MKSKHERIWQIVRIALVGAAIFSSAIPTASHAKNLVYIRGLTSTNTSQANGLINVARSALCDAASQPDVFSLYEAVDSRLEETGVAPDAAFDVASATLAGIQEACKDDFDSAQFFHVVYADCRMTMRSGPMTMDFLLPPAGGGRMVLIDHQKKSILIQPFDPTITLGLLEAVTGEGFNKVGDPEGTSEYLGLQVDKRHFDFKATILPAELRDAAPIAPQIVTTGFAWVTDDVLGLDIIRAFYESFKRVVDSGQMSSGALFGGLFNHQLLDHGMPMRIEQTTSMQIGGISMQSTEDKTDLLMTPVLFDEPPNYCSADFEFDQTYEVTDMSEVMASATSGSPPGVPGTAAPGTGASTSAPGSPDDLASAFAGLNSELANLSDEDRAALQSAGAGLGQLIGGLVGNEAAVASNDAPDSDAQAAAAQNIGAGLGNLLNGLDRGQGNVRVTPQGAAPGSASTSPSARPSSATLITDDLTQSAQKLLEALGYDPGNTDGELSTETVIAISQFQAEKGLDVTGAVTPQLIGILAAAVDK
jgi:hypothetical protein